MNKEVKTLSKKLPSIFSTINATPSSIFYWSKILPTTWNRMIATASFTIPSPKTIEKSLGYLFGLIIVRAATESDAQMVALYLMINAVDSTISVLIFPHYLINSKFMKGVLK